MSYSWSRRGLLAAIGVAAIGVAGLVQPAAAQGTLAKVKAAGVLRVGIADNIPWSRLNPDGTLTGLAPLQVEAVAKKLGIPKLEATVVSYADLVPGLLAGRWDMVAASLTITPARCAQVIFADPFYRFNERQFIGYLPGTIKELPKTFEDMAKQFDTIGMPAGAQIPFMQRAIETTKGKAKIVQFTDSQLLIEALKTKRVQVATTDEKTMELLSKTMGPFDIAAVDNGEPNRGSGGAFRKEDTEFRDAFVAAQRELKKAGEVTKILAQFGFVYQEDYMNISGDEACKL